MSFLTLLIDFLNFSEKKYQLFVYAQGYDWYMGKEGVQKFPGTAIKLHKCEQSEVTPKPKQK